MTSIHRYLITTLASAALVLPAAAGFFSKDKTPEEETAKDIVAVYDFDQPLNESGMGSTGLLGISSEAERPLTTAELSLSLQAATKDKRVKAIVLDLDQGGFSLSQLQEVRRNLAAARKAGKDVWLYTEYLSNGTALVGSAANKFCLMPEGNVSFNGLASQGMYFRGLLDKVGVTPQIIHIGDFKSAGEPFTRTGPSEEDSKQRGILLDSIFKQIVDTVASGRNLPREKVLELIDDPFMSSAEAKEAGLVDLTLYRGQFIDAVKEAYGDTAKIDENYALPERGGPEIDGMMDLFKVMLAGNKDSSVKTDHIAVVSLEGAISDETIAPVRTQILRAVNNQHAKALVFRVNSPGGSAQASDVLWQATEVWKATGKPFIVSMGDVAASGGYYVSADADTIFAEEGTITGSIGVIGMGFVITDMLDKMGINIHTTTRGANADIMNFNRPMTESEVDSVRGAMLDVYTTFKSRVTRGRGEKLTDAIDNLAGGRVYSGIDAKKIGLVDELGGVGEAIMEAAKRANLGMTNNGTPPIALYPKPISALEGFFAKPQDDPNGEFIRATAAVSTKINLVTQMATLLRTSGIALPNDQQKVINDFLSLVNQVMTKRPGQIFLIAPTWNGVGM